MISVGQLLYRYGSELKQVVQLLNLRATIVSYTAAHAQDHRTQQLSQELQDIYGKL